VSYRAALTGRALSEFRDFAGDQDAYGSLTERILELSETAYTQ
jgi:hypothetical protein